MIRGRVLGPLLLVGAVGLTGACTSSQSSSRPAVADAVAEAPLTGDPRIAGPVIESASLASLGDTIREALGSLRFRQPELQRANLTIEFRPAGERSQVPVLEVTGVSIATAADRSRVRDDLVGDVEEFVRVRALSSGVFTVTAEGA